MRRRTAIIALIVVMAMLISPAYAASIRISPYSTGYPNPIMLSSPAKFNITATQGASAVYQPHILLVMTNASYDGLSGDVTVTWTGDSITFQKTNFTYAPKDSENKIPPSVSADYTVASCADHLGVSGAPGVYYAYGPFLSEPITTTEKSFTVTASSTALRMLVYAIGNTVDNSGEYDTNVPHSQPGFIVPEPGPILAVLAFFSALAFYTIKHRTHPQITKKKTNT